MLRMDLISDSRAMMKKITILHSTPLCNCDTLQKQSEYIESIYIMQYQPNKLSVRNTQVRQAIISSISKVGKP
jgi:hypothetical protein